MESIEANGAVFSQNVRFTRDFGFGWKFCRGDITDAQNIKFDDSGWQAVDLPHDWSIEGPFSEEYASGTGYLPGGIGWYRKSFQLPSDIQDRKIYIQFDGIYNNSEAWCNGKYLGKRPNGYVSFCYDLTPYIEYGERKNIIAVRVDHSKFADSRWYTGSGIYRNVFLIITNKIHIKQYGTFVATPEITDKEAQVNVSTIVRNDKEASAEVALISSVKDADGQVLDSAVYTRSMPAGGELEFHQSLDLDNPILWSPDTPYLYQIHTQIKENGEVVDDYCTPFGIRHFRFDANEGFFLNGENMEIKGVCVHHDAGALGAAVPPKVWERRLRIFKEMGCNAVRMSHNPPDPGLLDLCDEMGFLVIDEAFDEWTGIKRKWVQGWNKGVPNYDGYAEDFEEWAEKDLRDMILRDRNHPCIILWSIGNEIDYPNDPFPPNSEVLPPIARKLVGLVKELDTTRPVTAALARARVSNEYAEALDVVGYNYQEKIYAEDHETYPNRVIYGSENGKNLDAWLAVDQNAYISAQFLWTGIDFLGEAGSWPYRNSTAGVLDLAGFRKPQFFFRQSVWSGKPVVHLMVRPDEQDETRASVFCYTNCESVELLNNDISMGEKAPSDSQERTAEWNIPIQWTTLKAIGKNGGTSVCRHELRKPGDAEKLVMKSDRDSMTADGRDIAHIEVYVTDGEGNLVSDATHQITCEIEGAGAIIGMESGDPQSHEDYKSNVRKAYGGKLLIYLQSQRISGDISISVTAPGLQSASLRIRSES